MSAAASRSSLQRATGELRIAFKRRDAQTALAGLHQQGCLKARFPRPTGWAEAVLLNSSGGIAGGDSLASTLHVGAGARACFAGQAAERIYRALPDDPPARIRTTLAVADDAAAEWLPQETILFDRSALDRELSIDLAPSAWFLGVEQLVFGRAAMGETVRTARIHDTIRLRRGGRLLLHDAIRLQGKVAATLARPAIAGGATCVATLVHAAPDAAARLDTLRAAWAGHDAGASAWDGLLVGRVLAQNGACLRRAVVAGLAALRGGRPLPRVWLC